MVISRITGELTGSPPHAWGIRPFIEALYELNAGSPPHAWGIRSARRHSIATSRFTPTRVGNTGEPDARVVVCGGSPPHAWGILRPPSSRCPGQSVHPHTRGEYGWSTTGRPTAMKVHPHTRGEYAVSASTATVRSPVHPHTRGEYVTVGRTLPLSDRFTPTRVGNTRRSHPQGDIHAGSPPHAWGIPRPRGHAADYRRFTPTRVGNTAHVDDVEAHLAVHPHTRGEYDLLQRLRGQVDGSPPHAWGIL